MSKQVIIIGAGGHSKVVADIIRESGDEVFGYLDDQEVGPNVLGKVSDAYKYKDKYFIIGIGNNAIRKKICSSFTELNYYTAIHPRATVSVNAKIGQGSCIMANSVINSSAEIGEHCIINTACVVEHDNIIEDFVHISPGAILCGSVRIGTETHIGAGVVVKNNICICGNVVVGISAAVTKNIEEKGTYVGVPAVKIK